jgi:hypothetical protein
MESRALAGGIDGKWPNISAQKFSAVASLVKILLSFAGC